MATRFAFSADTELCKTANREMLPYYVFANPEADGASLSPSEQMVGATGPSAGSTPFK
jgi:hypothetical protein